MLLPIGHEESKVRRWPWISLAVVAACILVHFRVGGDRTSERAEQIFYQVVEYYYQHPYLEPDEELANIARSIPEFQHEGQAPGSDDLDAQQLEAEQEELDRLIESWHQARDDIPMFRWGLVPNELEPRDLITSIFMHAGFMHLIGNLLFFWLSGPPLEDVWGRPVFAAFFLASGIVGGLLWVARYPESGIPLVGASGAVAGLMGAFMVRFWSAKIRMFFFFFITGTFTAPAWVMLLLWFGSELYWTTDSGSSAGEHGGVANLVHVGGFAFGAATAVLIRQLKTEEKVLRPKIAAKLGDDPNTVVEQAHDLREQGRLQDAWELLATEAGRRPDNWDTNLALWDVALQLGRARDAAAAFLCCIRQDLDRGEHDLAVRQWFELTEHVPDVDTDVDFKIHLAEALLEEQRDREAAELLATADQDLDPSLPLRARIRLARAATQSRSASAPAICRAVLRAPALSEEVRRETNMLLARVRGQGLRTPRGQAPAPAGMDEAGSARVRRVLKVISAVPKRLTGDKIAVDVAGQGARLMPLKNIRAVAAARIDDGSQNAFVVIDLLVDPPSGEGRRIRTVRLISNEFDARAIVAAQSDPHQALAAFIDNLVVISGASPMPDADTVRGQPFYSFASLSEYESMVFGFVA